MERTRKNKVDLFLDSGAYSAFTKGVKIDIKEYIEFIKEHEDSLEIYSNLDVIPTKEMTKDEAAKKTWKNQKIMEKAGLSPVPVFHYQEPLKYLEYYVENYDYISLGGMVPVSNTQLRYWLDPLWSGPLTDEKGVPKVKVHGFGLTSLKLMLEYPWYSVDSTSWVVTGRLGSVYVPLKKGGQWIYDENSLKVNVSNKSPSKKDKGQHIDTLPPKTKETILEYLKIKGYKLGKSEFKVVDAGHELADNEKWAQAKKDVVDGKRELEIIYEVGISNTYQLRDEMNIIYFQDLERTMPEWPWPYLKNNADGLNFETL